MEKRLVMWAVILIVAVVIFYTGIKLTGNYSLHEKIYGGLDCADSVNNKCFSLTEKPECVSRDDAGKIICETKKVTNDFMAEICVDALNNGESNCKFTSACRMEEEGDEDGSPHYGGCGFDVGCSDGSELSPMLGKILDTSSLLKCGEEGSIDKVTGKFTNCCYIHGPVRHIHCVMPDCTNRFNIVPEEIPPIENTIDFCKGVFRFFKECWSEIREAPELGGGDCSRGMLCD